MLGTWRYCKVLVPSEFVEGLQCFPVWELGLVGEHVAWAELLGLVGTCPLAFEQYQGLKQENEMYNHQS